MDRVRDEAVAGMFYPESPDVLERVVRGMLGRCTSAVVHQPKALIVPHAGYVYSGQIAADAYACLSGFADSIARVVLLGPAHRVSIRGLALPGVDWFRSPLGVVAIDAQGVLAISSLPQVVTSAQAHAAEHSLEVQLPFLQTVLGRFSLVPLVVGAASAEEVAEVLEALWGGPETLIVVSSDLSHFLTYEGATVTDQETVQSVLALRPLASHDQACGATPINGLLLAARHHHLRGRLLALCNSGDSAGDRARVVGYGSFAFSEESGHE